MLSKDKNGERWFSADGRDVTIEEGKLEWVEEGRIQIFHADIERKDEENSDKKQKVLELLRQHPNGLTWSEMKKKDSDLGAANSAPKWLTGMIEGDNAPLWSPGKSDKHGTIFAIPTRQLLVDKLT
jgi:hypothetical protein